MVLKRIRQLLGRRKPTASDAEIDTGAVPVHKGPAVVHQPIPIQDLDPDAVKILRRLTRFDHTAYLVGGCVRDLLLERKPKDFDIGTSATPRQVKRLFSNSRIIGRRFRLAHVYFHNGKIIEVATFRARDPVDTDGDLLIRDDNVFGTAEEDALRRDFTINSLFYDVNQETVLDHADGLGDLRRKLVRTIGDPDIRFREDPIRMLRAIRFAARLDFEIEAETLAALERHRTEIEKSAPPRILEEINRLCRAGAAARSFELLRDTGFLEVILPEFAPTYREPESWRLFHTLLGAIDRRASDGSEITTGDIMTVMLVPVLSARMGWKDDGSIDAVKGLKVREMTDDAIRPIALRLRIPRKDQERCRQTLATLHRMVPAGKLRRVSVRATARRPAFEDAMWVLSAVAGQRDGSFGKALEFWRSVEKPEAPVEAERRAPANGEPSRKRKRRRKRSPAPVTKPPTRSEKLPPVWDDDYFFAALPSVPDVDDDTGDRYGAGALRRAGGAEPAGSRDDDGQAPTPRGGRKRRRRRRRRSGEAAPAEGPAKEPEERPS